MHSAHLLCRALLPASLRFGPWSAMRLLTALLMLFASAACLAQADYAREMRWADEITSGLVVGDAVYLAQKSGHKFLAIYTQAAQPHAAVITVHGMGVHPDWALIGALRSGLSDQGYTTLSVQMPVLAADAKGEEYPALFADAAERLRAAVAFLKSKGHQKLALASHSMGSRMSNFFLAGAPDHGIHAWVCIGISSGEFAEPGKLRLPVLDIYGERDLPQVRQRAEARAAVLKTLKGSAQIEVAGADHYFAGHENELVRQVRQFLDQRLK
jgi:predicted alpha/beta-hydrolase family hydrolase